MIAKLKAYSTSAGGRFSAFVAFLVLVGLTGGGSRSDIQSLTILRPASVMFAAYAILQLTPDIFRSVRTPLLIVLAMMAAAVLQLVPLPYSIWSSLPHRELIAEMDALAGIGEVARPLTLDPGATWNALFSLFVPLAAIALVAVQSPDQRRKVVFALAAMAMVAVVFGFLQAAGVRALYLYQITNIGSPVGLFSNRNHFGMLVVWLMPCASWLVAFDRKLASNPRAVGAVALLVALLLPLLVLTGSRAGILLAIPAIVVSSWLLARTEGVRIMRERIKPRWRRLFVASLIFGVLGAVLALAAILLTSGHVTGLSRLLETNHADEVRWIYLPIYLRMAADFLPFGSGLGSFEAVFYSYEPHQHLTTRYMNQAHNDLVQIVLEAGIVGAAVLLVGCAWLVAKWFEILRAGSSRGLDDALFLGFGAFLWLAGSLADYPLRTPLGALVFASLTALIGMTSRSRTGLGPAGRLAGS